MLFEKAIVKNASTVVHLQRQNAWSEKDLTALINTSYSKCRQ